MILGTPDNIPVEQAAGYHGGQGPFLRRTLLDGVPGSVFKYVRDVTIPAGSAIGEHHHVNDDEVFFIISGTGMMRVDDDECRVGPGTAVLTLSGSAHSLRNDGPADLRIFVACAKTSVG